MSVRVISIPDTFPAVVDDTLGGLGATKHYRINESSGVFVDRLGNGAPGVESGTLTRETGALVKEADGGSSVGGKLGPYINIPDLLPYANSFTVGAMVMIDRAPTGGEVKFIIFASSDDVVAGAYSVEIFDDLSVRIFSRQETSGVVQKRTAINQITVGVPFWIGYSRGTEDDGEGGIIGKQRLWIGTQKYGNDTSEFPIFDPDPTVEDTTNAGQTWRAPPAGDHAVMAFSDGAKQLSGILGELVVWSAAIPTADVVAVAAEALDNVVWLASDVDLGTVVVDAAPVFKAIPTASIHPESGLTAVVDTGPTGSATAVGNGQGFNVGGATEAESATFTAHVTIGAATSLVETFEIETIENGGGGGDNTPRADTDNPLFSRDTGNTPSPDDPIFDRAAGNTPTASTNRIYDREGD